MIHITMPNTTGHPPGHIEAPKQKPLFALKCPNPPKSNQTQKPRFHIQAEIL